MAEVEQAKKSDSWSQKQVYIMSAICIIVGLAFGYLLRGSESASAKTTTPVAATQVAPQAPAGMPPQSAGAQQPMPSLDDMKRMADKKVEPLLAQLKADPKNPKLMVEIGNTYKSTHQFKEAAIFYGQALALSPRDIALRDEVGGAQYYSGDVDQAIATFEAGLKYNPNDASTLFDLGVMKLQKKNDAKGAIELWQRLLKTNPNLAADKKDQIQKMIADAQTKVRPVVN